MDKEQIAALRALRPKSERVNSRKGSSRFFKDSHHQHYDICRAIREVCVILDLPKIERVVFKELVEHVGWDVTKDNHLVCWPSIPKLVEATAYDRKSVMRAIKGLEGRGVLQVTRRHREPNVYEIHVPAAGLSRPEKVEQEFQDKAHGW